MFLEEKRKKELSEANARERATDTEVNRHSNRELYSLNKKRLQYLNYM